MASLKLLLLISFIFYPHTLTLTIEWNQITIPSGELYSMTTISDYVSDTIYFCGGKISLLNKASACISLHLSNIMSNNFGITDYTLKTGGQYPGIYFNTIPFASATQNEGGIYDNRLCMLALSDGSNEPKSLCCDITLLLPQSTINCDDLQYSITNDYPQRFDSCVIHDSDTNMLYQIGGYYGQNIFDSILCFDLQTETYLAKDECNYGNLNQAMNENKSAIITVGGLDTLTTNAQTKYSNLIHICNSEQTICEPLALSLNNGIIKPRVFAIDSCNFGIVGGVMKVDVLQIFSSEINIANICTQTWSYNALLPIPLSEMGIIKTNDILCLFGGITFDMNEQMPMLSDSVYCTEFGNDSEESMNRTSHNPSVSPTHLYTESTELFVRNLTESVEARDVPKIESFDEMTLIGIVVGCTIVLLLIALICIYKIRMRLSDINGMEQIKRKHMELHTMNEIKVNEATEDTGSNESETLNSKRND